MERFLLNCRKLCCKVWLDNGLPLTKDMICDILMCASMAHIATTKVQVEQRYVFIYFIYLIVLNQHR